MFNDVITQFGSKLWDVKTIRYINYMVAIILVREMEDTCAMYTIKEMFECAKKECLEREKESFVRDVDVHLVLLYLLNSTEGLQCTTLLNKGDLILSFYTTLLMGFRAK